MSGPIHARPLRVAIVTERPELELARALALRIGERERLELELVVRERYPVADAMVRFLAGLDARFDLALVLISARPRAKAWILRELQLREHYPRCHPLPLDALEAFELGELLLTELE